MNLTEQETKLIEALRKAEVKDPVMLVRFVVDVFWVMRSDKFLTWDNGLRECIICQAIHSASEEPHHSPDCPGMLSERLVAILNE